MNQPVRLHKVEKEEDKIMKFITLLLDRIEAWVLSHAFLCLIVLMSLLIAVFVVLLFILVGVSATESGVTYNHFADFI